MIPLLLLSIVPMPDVVIDQVDAVEVNHVHDPDTGKRCFTQVIFWRWVPEDRAFRVVDWRMVKSPNQRPACGQLIWFDGDRLRKIRTISEFETWTFCDPELLDRRKLSECRRWKLSR